MFECPLFIDLVIKSEPVFSIFIVNLLRQVDFISIFDIITNLHPMLAEFKKKKTPFNISGSMGLTAPEPFHYSNCAVLFLLFSTPLKDGLTFLFFLGTIIQSEGLFFWKTKEEQRKMKSKRITVKKREILCAKNCR